MDKPSTIIINLGEPAEEQEEAVVAGLPSDEFIKEARNVLHKAEEVIDDINNQQGRFDGYIAIADRYLHIHKALLDIGS